ncbi:hypothetical protein B0J11DRAFT_506999 [Dendryphion nanum]|uniref:Uncharacterized protein n=1 Tax=Dendryphion nanum TaxID=256645 RepID=A0A9P9DRA9_9PLEO|nr:hypothetical protein B0J11DRAFT_506999 [Dendryphion nanum]
MTTKLTPQAKTPGGTLVDDWAKLLQISADITAAEINSADITAAVALAQQYNQLQTSYKEWANHCFQQHTKYYLWNQIHENTQPFPMAVPQVWQQDPDPYKYADLYYVVDGFSNFEKYQEPQRKGFLSTWFGL